MQMEWKDLEEEIYSSFSVIAIHTGLRPYRLAYALNKHLGLQFKRSTEDLHLKTRDKSFYFLLYEFTHPQLQYQYDLVGNRSIRISKFDGLIHYENLGAEDYGVGYFIPEHRKVDYFLKIEVSDYSVPLEVLISQINKINGVQSVYLLDRSLIKSIYNLIFD